MIRQLVLRNCGPYRGEHVVRLDATSYAVQAVFEGEPGRSNTAGKSFLLEMIRFAVEGKFRKERQYDADGWISLGEREGAVSLVLDGDVAISRTRRRGQATQIRFSTPTLGKPATQDEAQAAIRKYLGFGDDPDDFSNTGYFEQGRMARLLHADPGDRLAVVSRWLGLGFADRAEDRTGEIAAEHAGELGRASASRAAIAEQLARLPDDLDSIALRAEEEQMAALVVELRDLRELRSRRSNAAKAISNYDEIVEVGKARRARLDELRAEPGVDDAQFEALEIYATDSLVALEEARRERGQRARVAEGEFDGVCPVAGIACPATKAINEGRLPAKRRLREAEKDVEEKERRYDALLAELGPLRQKRRSIDAYEAEVSSLRDQIRRTRDDVAAAREVLATPLDEGRDLDYELRTAEEYLGEIRRSLASAEAGTRLRREASIEIERLGALVAKEAAAADLAVRAKAVFRAAQRRVAERALALISGEATRSLRENGVDLGVAFRWEREGKEPAKACERCGTAFPRSAKTKECDRCGAERGVLLVPRLDPVISARSGGADDVAGVALQLAAGAWLLRARESPWHCCLLDEPFAHVDRAWRTGLATALARYRGWYRQLLVISHDPATTAMFPARILVTVARDGSRRIEVT